ncbi:HAD-IA family hydrolase [Peptoniphilus stercorisuis]|uniref:Phosphoglycolate phosphatase n=1 Tax=Peptoniphilus stercorisuis TaxID=1436965 RepID=A0ABS4KDC9_9FIRM|nr:HAD-IA family hydrolase [Peptoniphilus stercorisuis]MBP2025781.1 phosphoglycolate phosphatase [Peptoniphilus stercorisuis]
MIFLFDLDGTLTDSEEGILKAFKYTLEKMNLEKVDDEILKNYIGPPLNETFKRKFNLYDEDNNRAIVYFREYYREYGKYENIPYKRMKELLEKISKNNTLAVATSKVEDQAIEIVKHFDLDYFDLIVGATEGSSRSKKYEIIEYVLNKLEVKDRSKVYMIGDRFTDINGAHRAGINSIGVLWGFGSKEELEDCKADYIVKSVEELESLIDDIEKRA